MPIVMLPWSDRKPPATQKKKRAPKPAWLQQDTGRADAVNPANPVPKPVQASTQRSQRDVGREWEERAAQWLLEQGLVPVTVNVSSRRGEIDLIFADGSTAVVVEVRRRASACHGSAAESIDHHKRRRIVHTALLWWARTGARSFRNLRFDTLTFMDSSTPLWTRHAFDAEGSI